MGIGRAKGNFVKTVKSLRSVRNQPHAKAAKGAKGPSRTGHNCRAGQQFEEFVALGFGLAWIGSERFGKPGSAFAEENGFQFRSPERSGLAWNGQEGEGLGRSTRDSGEQSGGQSDGQSVRESLAPHVGYFTRKPVRTRANIGNF
jgi:hypothetical protein